MGEQGLVAPHSRLNYYIYKGKHPIKQEKGEAILE